LPLHPGDGVTIGGHPDGGEPASIDYIEVTPQTNPKAGKAAE